MRKRKRPQPLKAAAIGAAVATIPAILVLNLKEEPRKNATFIASMAGLGALTGAALSVD